MGVGVSLDDTEGHWYFLDRAVLLRCEVHFETNVAATAAADFSKQLWKYDERNVDIPESEMLKTGSFYAKMNPYEVSIQSFMFLF